jgi:type IV pilus assembly protein PilC
MAYKYKAYTTDKRIVQGTIEVTSESLAEGALYRAGYQHILSLKESPPGLSLERLIPTLFGVKTQDVIDFSNQLATLIESGITLLTALQLLEGQTAKPAFKRIISALGEELQGGISFSQALSKYPQVFPHAHCQVIKASEQAGNLEVGLRQAASYMENQAATSQKIKRAMLYPSFVLLMAIGVSSLLIFVALPPLVELFTSLGVELPWTTSLLIATAGLITNHKLYLLGELLILIMLIIGLVILPSGKQAIDRLMLKMPVIGLINIERHMHHFCQTTSMLLKAGLRLPQVIDIAIQTNQNQIICQALSNVREKLVQGEGLSQPMGEIVLFPRLLVEMVVVGEKTGTLDSTLATLADFYERRVNHRIDTLIAMIEPVLTLIVGLVVIFIALSMITPLYSILRSIH